MKKTSVRLIFIVVLIYLPLQYGLVGIIGFYHSEPWPAFVFPGFKNVFVYDEGFEIEQAYFEVLASENAETMRFLPQEFFPDIPLSQIPGFMRAHFRNGESEKKFTREARLWLKTHAETAAGFEAASIDVVLEMNYYSHDENGLVRVWAEETERFTIELF